MAIRMILMTAALFGLSGGFAFAEQDVPVNIPGGGAADLLNVTNIPSALDGSHDDSGVHFTCTDSYGRVYQKSDPAFNDCLAQRRKAGASAANQHPTPAALKDTSTTSAPASTN